MAGPKVTVIGAGSYFFGSPVIYRMATSPHLAGGTLALVDVDAGVLRTMMQIARRVFKKSGCGVKLIGSTDRREVMRDSDFVVLTFSWRNAHYRGVDTEIAARHGIRMCSGDTIGPGGIFRAMREVPVALSVARDARRLCPNAWVINFVNPTAVLGMALRRFAPDVRSFALCDGHHEPYCTLHWCGVAGIVDEGAEEISPDVQAKIDLAIGGVNHFTWLLRFRYDGKDMMPAVRKWVADRAREERKNPSEEDSKSRYNFTYAQKLFDVFGIYPDTIGHSKEYVPYFQGYGVRQPEPEPIALFDAPARAEQMAEEWRRKRKYASGKLSPDHFLKHGRGDHATDIIESMWGGLGKSFFINTTNGGAITNLSDDAFLECRCDVDMRGPRPQPTGAFPRGVLALQQQVLDTHELTAEAAATGDKATLRRAMLTDPICNNIPDADACIRDLLAAQKDVLPGYWYKRTRR